MACEFDEGAALLDTVSNRYFSLNAVGHFIWEQLADPLSLDQIAGRVSDRYGIERDLAAQDARALLDSLAEHRLIFVK